MFDRICNLYKRIMKHDVDAINEIKTLEEAKEIIKMMVCNAYLTYQTYQDALDECVNQVERFNNKYRASNVNPALGVHTPLDIPMPKRG